MKYIIFLLLQLSILACQEDNLMAYLCQYCKSPIHKDYSVNNKKLRGHIIQCDQDLIDQYIQDTQPGRYPSNKRLDLEEIPSLGLCYCINSKKYFFSKTHFATCSHKLKAKKRKIIKKAWREKISIIHTLKFHIDSDIYEVKRSVKNTPTINQTTHSHIYENISEDWTPHAANHNEGMSPLSLNEILEGSFDDFIINDMDKISEDINN